MLTKEHLSELFHKIRHLSVIMVGDFFLDKYFVTDPRLSEISVETGLEARQVIQIRCSPGAAGTVVNNLHALGVGDIRAVGITGDDGEGYELNARLREMGVNTDSLLRLPFVHTPTYMKPMRVVNGVEVEMERLDVKNRTPLTAQMEDQIISILNDQLSGKHGWRTPNAVVISDQVEERNCGVISDRVREALSEMARRYPETIFFADSRRRIGEFNNIILKPNRTEALEVLKSVSATETFDSDKEIAIAISSLKSTMVFLTSGENGIWVARDGEASHAKAIRYEGMIDICGAGDSATSGIVSALASGFSPIEAAEMGNLCAGVTIRKLGTTGTASEKEILSLLNEFS